MPHPSEPQTDSAKSSTPPALEPAAFDELDTILDDLRTRYDETPQWEFCEGFMAALICSRRPIAEPEYLAVLLDTLDENAPDAEPTADAAPFASTNQRARFMRLWRRRWDEVVTALDTEVEELWDERAYGPEVIDVRAAVAEMPDDERADFERDLGSETLPAFAQVWALGFMYAVESWPEDWVPPRDKEHAKGLNDSLNAIVALTDDDSGKPEASPLSKDGPPSVSHARLMAFGDAIWAVYAMRALWQTLGPRVETVRRDKAPGRNDACPCGSGKKYKKCCGAA